MAIPVQEQLMTDREDELRERAYYIWEAEGRPEGRAHVHWQMAEIATTVLKHMESATALLRASLSDNAHNCPPLRK